MDTFPHDYYIPRYSNGQCTAMTASAAMKIYQVARKTDRRDFRIEDMLFTGIFREKAQVKNITGLETPGKCPSNSVKNSVGLLTTFLVCEHFQYLKPKSTELLWLTNLYQKGKLKIQPHT